MPDYEEALHPKRVRLLPRHHRQRKVLAVTMLFPVVNQDLSAIRFVVSLADVDSDYHADLPDTLIGFATLMFDHYVQLLFYQSIVPRGRDRRDCAQDCSGDFNTRLEKKNDDEIAICAMSSLHAQELATSEQLKTTSSPPFP
jgi:hypothetical protein